LYSLCVSFIIIEGKDYATNREKMPFLAFLAFLSRS
jgi:hypothetical protein